MIDDFLPIGSTTTNGILKKRRPADSSDVTRYIRITSQFRPYVTGGATGNYLPKGGYWGSQELRQSYSLGFRFGPIFDGTYRRPQN
jgi:hypothetical protein